MISQFDILAISEHSLFEEHLGILKSATDNTYNFHAVSASDNPCIISGEKAHGGVVLLWKTLPLIIILLLLKTLNAHRRNQMQISRL